MLRGPYGLIGLIRKTWDRVRRELDEGGIAKRLARRGMGVFRAPPRGWCLVVKACDTRITPMRALITPEWAADARNPAEHTVVLDQRLVRRLCAPVLITPPGELWGEVAAKLGTTKGNLLRARWRGVFESRYLRMGGQGGAPVPLLYTDKVLDPSGPLFVADSVWNLTGAFMADLMAEGFEQAVVRVPRFVPARGVKGYAREGAKTTSYRLPPVPPDYVWYKWKGGVYVGDAGDRKRAARREWYARREGARARRRERGSRATGSLRFGGWMFVCPGCKRTVQRLYCPLPAMRLRVQLSVRGGAAGLGDACEPLHAFACHACHRVVSGSLWEDHGWNTFIGHVTGGLLYGHEVPRPEALEVGRKRAHRPQVNRTARKREAVLERLIAGMTLRQIAVEMGISLRAVKGHLHLLCKHEGVKSRLELVRKMGATGATPLNGRERAAERRRRVVELMREGLSDEEIRLRLSMRRVELWLDIAWLYRRHGVDGVRRGARRRALAEKMGVARAETRGERMRRSVAELRGAGMTWVEVAKELGMSLGGAHYYARFLKPRARHAVPA